jgi:hypothetical protein
MGRTHFCCAKHRPSFSKYNDGSLHRVDKNGHLLYLAFPAVLDMDSKFGRTGPYFNLAAKQGIKVTSPTLTSYQC